MQNSKACEINENIGEEETKRKNVDLKTFKEITNFDNAKEKLANIKLELPEVPRLENINVNRLSKKRDEKILEEIIKPKDNMITELYQDNIFLRQELLRKSKMFEKAEKYQKELEKIMEDNENLHNEVEQIKSEYKQKEFDIEWKYISKIRGLEKENSHLYKIIDKFKETIGKFICPRFPNIFISNLLIMCMITLTRSTILSIYLSGLQFSGIYSTIVSLILKTCSSFYVLD